MAASEPPVYSAGVSHPAPSQLHRQPPCQTAGPDALSWRRPPVSACSRVWAWSGLWTAPPWTTGLSHLQATQRGCSERLLAAASGCYVLRALSSPTLDFYLLLDALLHSALPGRKGVELVGSAGRRVGETGPRVPHGSARVWSARGHCELCCELFWEGGGREGGSE